MLVLTQNPSWPGYCLIPYMLSLAYVLQGRSCAHRTYVARSRALTTIGLRLWNDIPDETQSCLGLAIFQPPFFQKAWENRHLLIRTMAQELFLENYSLHADYAGTEASLLFMNLQDQVMFLTTGFMHMDCLKTDILKVLLMVVPLEGPNWMERCDTNILFFSKN